MVTGLVPVPGSVGVSEAVFNSLFINPNAYEKGFFVAFVDGVVSPEDTIALHVAALNMEYP